MITTQFGDLIADRIQAEHRALAARWFERLLDLLPVDARDVFPTDSLLDHVPALILEIGGSLREPEAEAIAANTAILDKARELGALRHTQKASLHQVVREYHLLGRVLVTFVMGEIETIGAAASPSETVQVVARLHQAVEVLSQSTVETFVGLYTQTITEQTERLEQFTRMAAHEWRQPLSALQFGVSVLRLPDIDRSRAELILETVQRSVTHLVDLTHKLESVARMHADADNAVVQEVSIATVAQEAARQLREMSDSRGVSIRVDDALPVTTVDVGRLELVLVNLLSNAIKYSDPQKPERTVEITGAIEDEGCCRLEIRDNGVGIPAAALDSIFQRFTRAHTSGETGSEVDGLGLGLAIVDDCVKGMGGRVAVQSAVGAGTTFVLRLPIRAGRTPNRDRP